VPSTRWLIFAPVAILALFSTVTNAEPIEGLNTTYYVIDEIPPAQSTSEYEECGSELENNINRSYDGEPYEECTGDLFMVHMTGFITIPEHETIEFFLASDDGGEITIGDNTFGLWKDQGCSATMSGNLTIEAGSQPLELWMYENSGVSCLMLAWKIDDNEWEIVPEWAFTTESTPQTTTSTTTVPTETVPVTDPTTTTLQETTTTVEETTTSSELVTTTLPTVETSTSVETTTTTEYVSPPVAQPPAVVEPEPIEEPTTEDTEPIQEPEEVVEETIPLEPPDTDPTVETDDTLPFVEEPEDEDFEVFDATPVLPDDTTPTEVLPDEATDEIPVEELSDEELITAIESIEEGMEVSEELAVAVAQSAEVVASLSSEEATSVFEAIEVDNLSTEEAQAIVEAVQDAPAEVREAFEEEINIFSPGFDNYVPLGSSIPVSTRRTLIAVAAGAAIAATGTRRP
jgi:hypothetical protein